LDIGHPVVEPQLRVLLEDDGLRAVTRGVLHAHRVLSPEAKAPVKLGVVGRQHPAVTRGNDLSRVERETGHDSVGSSHALPTPVPKDLASRRASRILDDWQAQAAGDFQDARHVGREPHLVDAQNRPGLLGSGCLQ
jgi:hypothetical protein